MSLGFNKGALGIRLELRGRSYAFVNCHLAAGHAQVIITHPKTSPNPHLNLSS